MSTAAIHSTLQNMIQKHDIPMLDENTIDNFLVSHEKVVLFFSENPQRYPESNDVAMVLPELLKHFEDLKGAVINPGFEHKLQQKYDFTAWPALAFFKNGQYLSAITGIQNWQDYQVRINKLFTADPNLILRVSN